MLLKYIKFELDRLKAGVWVGLAAIIASLLLPLGASAVGQTTARSLTLGSSAVSANTTYKFAWTPSASQTIGSVVFQVCDSPLQSVGCANAAGSLGFSFTAPGASLTGQSTLAGFSQGGAGTGGAPTVNSYSITKAVPQAGVSTGITVTLSNAHNPSTTNTSFYGRMYVYSDSNATTLVDYGAVAVSTANQVNLAANVQESLAFCVYTLANCGAGGSSVNLGTGADNVLSAASPTGGTSKMDISTNAQSGYVITYLAAPLAYNANQFNGGASQTQASFTAGTEEFGINVNTVNTTPAQGAAITGTAGYVTPTYGGGAGDYVTANKVSFVPNASTTLMSTAAPTVLTTSTVNYLAQAGNTTKAGQYVTTFTYVATGTF
jgi:hypothetical protein